MSALGSNSRRRWLKSGMKWPGWLRHPRLLRWALFVGMTLYRLWRLWRSLTELFHGLGH
jgi:hypothetical protein